MLSEFFQLGPVPDHQITGVYNYWLVTLSYLVSLVASYVALDVAGRLREIGHASKGYMMWLFGGAFAMGAGIWSMHFIGMLAFNMTHAMGYDPYWTGFSMLIAILASAFALYLFGNKKIHVSRLVTGGIILGMAILLMHYTGMAAMLGVKIHYLPGLFFLSVVIAIAASEAALALAIQSNKGTLGTRIRLKAVSAAIMGAAICGMHYTGMAAAVFTPTDEMIHTAGWMDPLVMSVTIAIVTFFILSIAFAASAYQEMLNYQSIRLARQSGKAEMAVNVLHNIGNVLNSVNVSVSLLAGYFSKSRLDSLKDVNELLQKNRSDLTNWLTQNETGKNFPDYIMQLSDYWTQQKEAITEEIKKMTSHIQHIKDIVSRQQSLSGPSNVEEVVSIENLMEESVSVASMDFAHANITIEKKYKKIPPVMLDRIKLAHVMVNLLRNAKDALMEVPFPKKIILTVDMKNQILTISVSDNGCGILHENLTRIFSHGFTTRKNGHGFGLHASALSINEMGGNLTAASEGVNRGSTFTIELPCKIPN